MKPVSNTILLILSLLFVFLPPSALLADDPPPGYPPPIPTPAGGYPDPAADLLAVDLITLDSAESPIRLALLYLLCLAVILSLALLSLLAVILFMRRQGRRLP